MRQIGDYEILSEIDRGGMGCVFRARGPDGVEVALKLLLDHTGSEGVLRKRFQREIQALTRLRHPNVAKILNAGEDDGAPYLVMRLYEGPTLQAKLDAEGPLDPEWSRWIASTLASALEHAHENGVVHRDLKPSNVVLLQDGVRPVLVDFGLTKVTDEGESPTKLTAVGRMQGTPGYWAPEQIEGDPTRLGPHTDVYGLGAILYACLTGRPPCEGDSMLDVVRATVSVVPAAPSQVCPGLSPDLDTIALRCLEKDPADRYSSISELSESLSRVARGESLGERPFEDGGPDVPSGWGRRSKSVAAGLAAAGVLLVTAIAILSSGRAEARKFAEQTAITERRERALAVFDEGGAKLDGGDVAGAIESYSRAIELDPNLAKAYCDRGLAKDRFHDTQGTTEDCGKALELDPKLARAYRGRGMAKKRLGDTTGAIEDCSKAIELDPNDLIAYLVRGSTRLSLGDRSGATEDSAKAIELTPGEAAAYVRRGALRKLLGDNRGALEDCDTAIELNPRGVLAHIYRGAAKFALGDSKGAIESYARAIQLNPKSGSAYSHRGMTRIVLKNYEGAAEDFTKAIRVNPRDAHAYASRARVRVLQGRPKTAVLDYEQALRLNPTHPRANSMRTFIREHQGGEPSAGK